MNRSAAPSGTQAVQRALRLLQSFAGGEEHGLSELAQRHGLAKATAHRLLAALEADGMLARSPGSSSYRLGPAAARLAGAPGTVGAPGTGARGQRSLPRTTPFHRRVLERHDSLQWRPWSGYVGAVSYEPTFTREYFAIRNAAALIDVSPLYKYEVTGSDALRLVDRVMTRDVTKCRVGQVMYSCWCDDEGKLVQDGNIVRLGDQRFRISAADPSLRWFQDCGFGMDALVRDISEATAALSLQGPRARDVLAGLVDDSEVASLRYFRAVEASFDGRPLLVTRTGYTGDLGYELWVAAGDAEPLWDRLMVAGEPHGMLPVGLMAMDAARIEAGLVLIEVDYVSATHAFLERRKSSPFEAGLGWTVKLTPGNEFIGRRALEREVATGSRWATVGIEVAWSELEAIYGRAGLRPQTVGEPPNREPTPVWADGRQIGQMTSQTFSPLLKKQIGLASIETGHSGVGAAVEVEMRVDMARVRARGSVVQLPFYDPPHKRDLAPARLAASLPALPAAKRRRPRDVREGSRDRG